MAKGHFIHINTAGVEDYMQHLKTMNYRQMNNGVHSLINQAANDIKTIYAPFVPRRTSGGRAGKYGATSGNLLRTLRKYKKRQTSPFVVEYTVGFKIHGYGELAAKIAAGKKGKDIEDGYYAFFLTNGVAGDKRRPSTRHKGFVEKARRKANAMIETKVSEKTQEFVAKKLDKALNKQSHG